jgi:hypothetical protein
VDDLLFKGDQLYPRWDLDAAPVAKEFLDAARLAGRAVVLTSDHGHLLDDDTASQGREAGERWRENTSVAAEGEVRVEGRRVLAQGRSSIVVPRSERIRYSGKKNGYHGGVSPQEMEVPALQDVATFCSQLAMRGAPVRAIQELAGRQDLGTSDSHINVRNEPRADVSSAPGSTLLDGRQAPRYDVPAKLFRLVHRS